MKRLLHIFCLVASLTLFSSNAATAAQLVDGIAAIVGSDIVLLSEIREREALQKGRFGSKQKMTRAQILEELIDERLLKQEMDRLGLEATPQEMNQAIRSVLAQNRMTLDQLKRELAGKGISWDSYEKDLADRIRLMRFMQRSIYSQLEVTEDDRENYRRRYPQKAKQESDKEIEQHILETKAQEQLNSYLREVRGRSFVEIKDIR